MKFKVCNGKCGYGTTTVLRDVSLTVESGEVLCLLGPNGAGKTTLFKSILGLLEMQGGSVELDGKDMLTLSRAQIARMIGYIPQAHNPPFPFKVLDVILMGRTAHLGIFASPGKEDRKIAEEILDILNIRYLRDKIYTKISGGEKQLVLIARALTQKPLMLVMDEPTASLDFGNQLLVLSHIRRLADRGLGIVMASHFPDHAFLYSTKVLLLKSGGLYAAGTPAEVITEQNLERLYGVNVKIVNTGVQNGQDKSGGREVKVCVPVLHAS